MNPPMVLGLATAVPESRHSQSDIFEELKPHLGRNRLARPIFDHTGVAYRHTVVDSSYYAIEQRTQARNERYIAESLPLGEAAVHRCLDAAGHTPQVVDDFFVVSCTGLEIPGLDLRLAGTLGMRPDLNRTCVLGMGCYGAFPALLRARQAVAARPGRTALVLALELCSLHFQLDDSTENVVSAALFADGAAAVLVGCELANGRESDMASGNNGHIAGPRLLDSATYCDYQAFEHMAFHLTDHGFQMRLSAYVPGLLAANVEDFVDRLLGQNDLCRKDIRFWGVHPGSSKILDHIQSRLGLSNAHLEFSRNVLREYGNMSSPTILFVLDEIQRCGRPDPGDYGVLLAFGPGLTMEGELIQW